MLNNGKKKKYKYVASVARCELGYPASSAQVDKDLGGAGKILNGGRSPSNLSLVDMSMFLSCNSDFTTSDILYLPVSDCR